MLITISRQRTTEDGIFGVLTIDSSSFFCFTVENRASAIPAGIYRLTIDDSPKFHRRMPHIIVPSRDSDAPDGDAGIRIHPANFPFQLEGCIAVGDTQEEHAVNNSKRTFESLFKIVDQDFDLSIEVKDIPQIV